MPWPIPQGGGTSAASIVLAGEVTGPANANALVGPVAASVVFSGGLQIATTKVISGVAELLLNAVTGQYIDMTINGVSKLRVLTGGGVRIGGSADPGNNNLLVGGGVMYFGNTSSQGAISNGGAPLRIFNQNTSGTIELENYGAANATTTRHRMWQANAVSAGELFGVGEGVAYTGAFAIGWRGEPRYRYTNATGTPGAVTIDKPTGRVQLAAGTGAAGILITNACVNANSIVQLTFATGPDATAISCDAVPGAGSFTIHLRGVGGAVNCTVACDIMFTVSGQPN